MCFGVCWCRYVSNTHLGARVGKLNPTWNQPYTDETLMAGFLKAVELAGNGAFCCGLPRGGAPTGWPHTTQPSKPDYQGPEAERHQ
jgi:hypothetical protein